MLLGGMTFCLTTVWCLQAAFEQVVARFPSATARLMEGMTRRLAAASTARAVPTTFGLVEGHTFGQNRASLTSGATGTLQRGEIVTIALVPAGEHPSFCKCPPSFRMDPLSPLPCWKGTPVGSTGQPGSDASAFHGLLVRCSGGGR